MSRPVPKLGADPGWNVRLAGAVDHLAAEYFPATAFQSTTFQKALA